MNYDFEITEQKEQPVLSVRTRTSAGSLSQACGKAYGAVYQALGEQGQSPAGIPFVAYYNMDMADLDVEIGVPVAKPIPGRGEVIQSVIPAGKQASCVYKGPYGQIGPAYDALGAWITEQGATPTGVCYEFYLNEPGAVPEEELLTKIVFLLN